MYVRTADTLKHEWSLTHFCTSIQTEGRTDGRKDEQTVGQKNMTPCFRLPYTHNNGWQYGAAQLTRKVPAAAEAVAVAEQQQQPSQPQQQ